MQTNDNLKADFNRLPNEQRGEDSNGVLLQGKLTMGPNRDKKSFADELQDLSRETLNSSSKAQIQERNLAETIFNETDWEKLLEEMDWQAQWLGALVGRVGDHLQMNYLTSQLEQPIQSGGLNWNNIINESESLSASEPMIELDKQNLKLKVDFPMLSDLQSVTVQYDPNTRSIAAEMITSREAAIALQNQVSTLERNLAKHNIKLHSLKIMPSSGNQYNQSGDQGQQKRRKSS